MESAAREAREAFDSGVTRSLSWRLRNLRAAERMLTENHDLLIRTVSEATQRPQQEVALGDVWVTLCEIKTMVRSVRRWAAPEEAPTPLPLIPASSRVEKQPYGATLIIGPFNYPVMLTLAPLFGAIAAGNTVVLKPSEHTPQVSELLERLLRSYLDKEAVRVFHGGPETVEALLAQRWDKIIFTGSERVGKIVAAAAARHLTPLTLELGGKCPVIVDRHAEPLASIAYKLAWGRLFNGGQSCIAPEYVLVPREQAEELAARLVEQLARVADGDVGRLVHAAAVRRVQPLLVGHGGTVLCGGNCRPEEKYVAPTVILSPRASSPIMCEELFAPVLCVVPVDSLDAAVAYVRAKPTPLALYIFTSSAATERALLDRLPSGSACINDVLLHFGNAHLPFAGLGSSGYGALHGREYFDACSHRRGVMAKSSSLAARLLDMQVWLRAPPYSPLKFGVLQFVAKRLLTVSLPRHYARKALVAGAAAALLYAASSSFPLRAGVRSLLKAMLDMLGDA
ncbi:hypothetical protein AB1Y20_007658 [Prymnesium parvum]|uniref:Aldehyde dehydrogenase n=1 Tax=Prymnesium parvum TaxID=97485 RepID=A0AB34IY75_PRYPA